MKKEIFRTLVAGVMATSFVGATASAGTTVFDKLKEKVNESSLKVRTDIVDVDLADLANLGLDIGLEVEPNRDKRTYSRIEKIKLEARLGDSYEISGPLAVSGSIQAGSEVQFIRQFPSQKEALNLIENPPYIYKSIPITARIAMDLEEKDYVKYKARMAMPISLGAGHAHGIVSVSGAISYVVYGDFQLEAYRKAGNKILLRASALKQKSKNFSLFAKLDFEPLKVFGVRVIDKQIERKLIPTKFVEVQAGKGSGDLFTLEYEYDLDSQMARQAYEDVVNPKNWLFKEYMIANPLRDADEVAQTLLVNFDSTERIFTSEESKKLPVEQRTVTRPTKSYTDFSQKRFKAELDLKVLGAEGSKYFIQQDFTFYTPSDKVVKYRLANYTEEKEAQFAWGWLGLEQRREADILFELDKESQAQKFLELSFRFERDEKTQLASERAKVEAVVHRMMPERYHEQLSLENFGRRLLEKDARTDIELVFHREAFKLASSLSKAEIQETLDQFLGLIIDSQDDFGWAPYYGQIQPNTYVHVVDQWEGNGPSIADMLLDDSQDLAEQLYKVLSTDSPLTYEQRWELLASLRNNTVFNRIGAGILSRLVDRAASKMAGVELEDLVSFKMSSTLRKYGVIEVVIGDRERTESFRKLVKAKNRILNREFDPSFWE